jgi:uncharacterized protein YkwD
VALICACSCGAQAAIAASRAPSRTCPGAALLPSARNLAAVDAATLCLMESMRAAQRLGTLRSNGDLRTVAASQVANMVRRDYFADVRPSGQTSFSLIAATRYRAHASISTGQIIAWGIGANATPARIVAAWMASPSHRAIILTGDYRDIGVAALAVVPARFARRRHGATYAIEFGARH